MLDIKKIGENFYLVNSEYTASSFNEATSKIVGVVKVKNGKPNIKGKNTGSFILIYGLAGQLSKNYKFNNLR